MRTSKLLLVHAGQAKHGRGYNNYMQAKQSMREVTITFKQSMNSTDFQ